MKKIITAILIILIFSVINCSKDNAKKDSKAKSEAEAKKTSSAKKIIIKNPRKVIKGEWKAVKLAQSWKAMRYKMPVRLILRKNGTFSFNVKISVVEYESQGTYSINTSAGPNEITLNQTYPREIVYEGIFAFVTKKKMKIIFYDRTKLPRPTHFIKRNVNIFVKN